MSHHESEPAARHGRPSTPTARVGVAARVLLKALLLALGGFVLAVGLAVVLLPIVGAVAPAVTRGTSDTVALGLGLLPLVALLGACTVGLGLAGLAVAGLVVTARDGRRTGAPGLVRAAARVAPAVALVVVTCTAAAALALLATPAISVAVVAAVAPLVRRAQNRRAELARLVWAVPVVPSLWLLGAGVAVLGGLLGGHGLRRSVDLVRRGGPRPGAVGAVTVLTWLLLGLGTGVVGGRLPTAASGPSGAALAGMVLLVVVWTALTGLLLGAGARAAGPAPRPRTPSARRGLTGVLRRRRTRVAAVTAAALLGQTALLVAVVPTARADAGPLVVDTLTDTGSVVDGACDTPGPCDLRSALARAGERVDSGDGDPSVTFGVSGTVRLAATLTVTAGTRLDGTGQQVVLDAGHAVRALELVLPSSGQEGASVSLTRLTVTGGRSAGPGAGLFADAVFVHLDAVTMTDNESAAGDGGAVAAPVVTVTGSFFAHNTAAGGVGGAVSASRVSWENSTSVYDVGRLGLPSGGAVRADSVTVLHGTFVHGGGVAGRTTTQVTNSVLDPGEAQFSCRSTDVVQGSGNVDTQGLCPGRHASPAPYGEPADNGGPTATVALLAGSPARGAGDPDQCLTSDQRGDPRPGGGCDAGAYESPSAADPSVSVTLDAGPDRPLSLGSSLAVTAHVTVDPGVPDGTVDVLDGTVVRAAALTVAADGTARADLTLPPGHRRLTARYTPSDGSDQVTSDVVVRTVTVASRIDVSADGPVVLDGPARLELTVVPLDADGHPLPSAPVPTGELEADLGTLTAHLPLVAGRATWDVDAVPFRELKALYAGDELVESAFTVVPVLTADVTTTTTLDVDTSAPHGSPVTATVRSRTAAGPAQGVVRLTVDGDERLSAALVDGAAAIDVTGLEVGPHTLQARFDGLGGGYASSTSAATVVTVVPATGTVVLDAPDALSTQEPLRAAATVSGSGATTLRLKDGDAVLAEVPTPALGAAPVRVVVPTVGPLAVGPHRLTAELVATTTTTGAVSAPVVLTVTAVGPGLGATASMALPGDLSTIAVTGPSDATGTLVLTDRGQGTVLADGVLVDGRGDLVWRADRPGDREVTVTFTPRAGSPYALGRLLLTVTVPRLTLPRPVLAWRGSLHPGDTTLRVDVAPAPGGIAGLLPTDPRSLTVDPARPVPTGTLHLELPGGGRSGEVTLVDGHADVPLDRSFGICPCGDALLTSGATVVLDGDDWYEPSRAVAPDVVTTPWPATVALTVPAVVPYGGSVPLSVEVTSPGESHGRVPTGRVVVSVDGRDLLPAQLGPGGRAAVGWTPSAWGETAHVTARFEPFLGDVGAGTAVPRELPTAPPPGPVVTLTAGGRPAMGQPVPVTARVTTALDRVPDGTELVLTATDDGRELARTTFRAGVADAVVVPDHGGSFGVVGRFDAVPGPRTYATAVLDLALPAPTTPVSVTFASLAPDGRAWMDQPLQVVVRPDLTEAQWRHARPFTVQLGLDGEDVGPRVELSADRRESVVPLTVPRRGPLQLTARTAGDGDGLGAGGGVSAAVDVVGFFVGLDLGPGQQVERGRPWTPPITAVTQDGRPLTLPVVVTITPVGSDERVFGCLATLPGPTGCEVPGDRLRAGSYDVTLDYAGDPRHEPAHGEGRLSVTSGTSSLVTSFDPPATFSPYRRWVVGQTVTAHWRVSTPTGSTPPGTVRVAGSLGDLCQGRSDAGSCTFTVPDPRAEGGDPALVSTFVPDSAGLDGATDLVRVPAPARCVPLRASVRYASPFAADRGDPGVPALTGSACTTSQHVPGFLSETGVDVDTTTVLGHAYDGRYSVTGVEATDAEGTPVPLMLGPDGHVRLSVGQVSEVVVVVGWTPRCVTVRASDQVSVAGGSLPAGGVRFLTRPNCADPLTPSADELAQLEGGELRVAAGTPVQVVPLTPRYTLPDGTRVPYTARDMREIATGTTSGPLSATTAGRSLTPDGPPAGAVWTSVPVQDTTIWPVLGIAPSFCRVVAAGSSIGGRIEVTGATLPLLDAFRVVGATAPCLTAAGRPGYVTGATLTVTATPDRHPGRDRLLSSEYYVEGFARPSSLALLSTDPTATGTDPGDAAYAPRTTQVVVTPADPDLARRGLADTVTPVAVFAQFGHVVCGLVRVRADGLPQDARPGFDAGVAPQASWSDCPAWQAHAGAPDRVYLRVGLDGGGGRLARVPASLRTRVSVVEGDDGVHALPASAPRHDVEINLQARVAATVGGRLVVAEAAELSTTLYGPERAPMAIFRNLELAVPVVADAVTDVQVGYYDVSCRPVGDLVQVQPAGFARVVARSRWCPEGEMSPRSGGGAVHLDHIRDDVAVPSLTASPDTLVTPPGWSEEVSPSPRLPRGSLTLRPPSGLRGAASLDVPISLNNPVSIDFCAPLRLSSRLLDPQGGVVEESPLRPGTFEVGDTCPDPGSAHLGYRVPIALTRAATLGLSPLSGPTSATLSLDGATSVPAPFVLSVQCVHLDRGHAVDADTGPTCPYAGGRRVTDSYLRGEQVQLSFDRENDRRFRSWQGVDVTDGDHAGLVMTADRSVTVDYEHLNIAEQAVAVLSSVAQRLSAVALTALTGVFLGAVSTLTLAAQVLNGVAIGLKALGVSGHAVDVIEASGGLLTAQVDLVGAVASCAMTWSMGGGQQPSLGTAGDAALNQAPTILGKVAEKAREGAGDPVSEAAEVGLSAGLTLAANPSAYFADPTSSWSSITDVGSCVREKSDDLAKRTLGIPTG